MGFSIAKDEVYYIYVLSVAPLGWYVGSTKDFERRMRSHFGHGGSVATKERRAIAIEAVFALIDYQIATDCAHERAEIIVAQWYAKRFGMANVRGAKHGKGWLDLPSPGNLRDIARYNKFAETPVGQELIAALKPVDPFSLLPSHLTGNLVNCRPMSDGDSAPVEGRPDVLQDSLPPTVAERGPDPELAEFNAVSVP